MFRTHAWVVFCGEKEMYVSQSRMDANQVAECCNLVSGGVVFTVRRVEGRLSIFSLLREWTTEFF